MLKSSWGFMNTVFGGIFQQNITVLKEASLLCVPTSDPPHSNCV